MIVILQKEKMQFIRISYRCFITRFVFPIIIICEECYIVVDSLVSSITSVTDQIETEDLLIRLRDVSLYNQMNSVLSILFFTVLDLFCCKIAVLIYTYKLTIVLRKFMKVFDDLPVQSLLRNTLNNCRRRKKRADLQVRPTRMA